MKEQGEFENCLYLTALRSYTQCGFYVLIFLTHTDIFTDEIIVSGTCIKPIQGCVCVCVCRQKQLAMGW